MSTVTFSPELLLQRLQAVGEETRLRLIQLLAGGERCVCELQDDLGAGQSRLSFHLRKLKEAGLVTDRKEGRWVYYTLVPGALGQVQEFIGDIVAGRGIPVLEPCCTAPESLEPANVPSTGWQERSGAAAACCGGSGG